MSKLLLIDDEADVRDYLQAALEDEGFLVETARDGLEALEIVRREDGETAGDVLRRLEHRIDGETIVVRGDVGVHAALGELLRMVDDARGPIVAGLLGGRPAGLWRLLPCALKKKDFPREPAAGPSGIECQR